MLHLAVLILILVSPCICIFITCSIISFIFQSLSFLYCPSVPAHMEEKDAHPCSLPLSDHSLCRIEAIALSVWMESIALQHNSQMDHLYLELVKPYSIVNWRVHHHKVCVCLCECAPLLKSEGVRRETGRIRGNQRFINTATITGSPLISFISCHRHSSINEQLGTEWLSIKSKLTPSSLIMSGTIWDRQSVETSCPPVRCCVVQWQEPPQRDEAHTQVHGQVVGQHTHNVSDDKISRNAPFSIMINANSEIRKQLNLASNTVFRHWPNISLYCTEILLYCQSGKELILSCLIGHHVCITSA